jgi:hypothetical protein
MPPGFGSPNIDPATHTPPHRLSTASGDRMNLFADREDGKSKVKNRRPKFENRRSPITNRQLPEEGDDPGLISCNPPFDSNFFSNRVQEWQP